MSSVFFYFFHFVSIFFSRCKCFAIIASFTKFVNKFFKLFYLFELLWDCLQYHEAMIPVNIKWNLLNSGVACYNHTGDNWRTKQLYEEIEKIKNNVPLMDYLGCLNRIAVMYADRYEFEKAYEIASKNVNSLETIKTPKKMAEYYDYTVQLPIILMEEQTVKIIRKNMSMV